MVNLADDKMDPSIIAAHETALACLALNQVRKRKKNWKGWKQRGRQTEAARGQTNL